MINVVMVVIVNQQVTVSVFVRTEVNVKVQHLRRLLRKVMEVARRASNEKRKNKIKTLLFCKRTTAQRQHIKDNTSFNVQTHTHVIDTKNKIRTM